MPNKRTEWSPRRGQADALDDISQVLDRPQPGETIQSIPDERITDSRYQARSGMDAEKITQLEQAMEETGFQGVVIARPHGDADLRERGVLELVFGHRRRAAWRNVCRRRGSVCMLPVIVRQLTDQQLLTIGAQENLQREDLDPVDEGQIVAWHQLLYHDKNQAEIGQLLGKSLSWVKSRSRIAQLPAPLKVFLRQRPRAVDQLLDIGTWYAAEPDEAVKLGARVVNENLTADDVRATVRGYSRPVRREEKFGAEPIVKEGAKDTATTSITNTMVQNGQEKFGAEPIVQRSTSTEPSREGTVVLPNPSRIGAPHAPAVSTVASDLLPAITDIHASGDRICQMIAQWALIQDAVARAAILQEVIAIRAALAVFPDVS